MRNLKLIFYFLALFVVFTACQKEEVGFEDGIGQNGSASQIGGEITLYDVNGDQLTKRKDFEVSGANRDFQEDKAKHDQIWSLVKKIIPMSHRDKLSKLLIYSGGKSQTAGFVDPVSNDLSKWRMGIAIDYAYEGGFNANNELSYTIIHEFGHILSLNNAQVNANSNGCANLQIQEGCTKENSYLNTIYKRHWTDIYDEFQTKHRGGEYNMEAFYRKYRDRFVTEYAATNLVEDFAEVFAWFVTQQTRPAGKSVAEKKILMLYEFPELVSLRNQIRQNTGAGRRAPGTKSLLPAPGQWKSVHKHHCTR